MIETIRRAIDEKGHLTIAANGLAPSADLYEAGLTPFAAIQVLLLLETSFAVEFPKSMLNRRTLSSINAILACIEELQTDEAQLRAA